jgi:NAD-dependent deacetylase
LKIPIIALFSPEQGFQRFQGFRISEGKTGSTIMDLRNPGLPHMVLAELESTGFIKSIITQNIDMLHQKAGSQNVIEIYSSPKTHSCLGCGNKYGFEEMALRINSNEIPHCDRCAGLIKPDIIFYGEALEKDTIEAAKREASKADLFLVIGTSLVVQPAALLPFFVLTTVESL